MGKRKTIDLTGDAPDIFQDSQAAGAKAIRSRKKKQEAYDWQWDEPGGEVHAAEKELIRLFIW